MKDWTNVREVWGLKLILTILLSNEDFIFKQTCQSELNMQKFSKMAFWQTFLQKTSFDKLFSILWTAWDYFLSWLWRTYFRSNLKEYLSESNGTCFIVISNRKYFIWTQVDFFEFLTKFHRPCMDLRLSGPCSSNSTVLATIKHIGMWYQVHILPIWTLKLS